MHVVEQALRDVQFLSRQIEKDSPRAATSLRTVYRMAATRRLSILLLAPVATDPDFHSKFSDWDPFDRFAGIQNLTVEQIIELRNFAVGSLVRLENHPQPFRQLAYRDLVLECDRALQAVTL